MANAGTQLICLTVLTLTLSAVSIQDEAVHFCLGQPQTFTCEVPKQGSLTRLEWRIDFEHSTSETSVTRVFTSSDPEGQILRDDRPGVRFVFNLTSNSSSNLVSVMTLSVDDINATALINNATINCGSGDSGEPFPVVLHIIKTPHSQTYLMNLTNDLMKVQWNSVPMADRYIISVSPDPQVSYNESDSESTFITFNTTINLHLQYNRDYNISVMASNCAGNSTSAQISMRVGNCALSTSEYDNVNFTIESSSGWMEGSKISFYCHSNRDELMEATCSNNGSWYPDPLMKCQKNYEKMDISSEVRSKLTTWHVVTAVIIAIIAVVLLGIIGAVVILTVYRKHSLSQKIRLDHSNYYSDLPGSTQLVSDNQEMGIYSLLQPEEQRVTRVQSTEQTTTTLVYADVGSTLSRNPNTNANISLQLDDDCVQYADLKQHHQQPPELHQKASSNSHSDAPVDLDSLLIHLRSEVTPKWRQFGEAVGISEEVLKKYSNYPPEECIVEVFDYWLRNYHPSPTDKPTWRDVADVLIKMELHQLADGLLQSGPPVPVDMNTVPEHLLQPDLQSKDELPPPLPPKIANLDEEMMSSDATKTQLK